jgi:iron-sulfur cluster insertion protein
MEVRNNQTLAENSVTFTEAALNEIKNVISQQEKSDLFVRIFITGGCGGIAYGMALDSYLNSEDWKTEAGGLTVAIDNLSLQYVQGANVDFQDGEKPGFKITNPNINLSDLGGGCCSTDSAGSSCGSGSCGSGSCGSGNGGCC